MSLTANSATSTRWPIGPGLPLPITGVTLTSTTKTTAKALSKAEVAKLQADIDAAEAAQVAALDAIAQAETEHAAALAEQARIDGLITSGDLTYGRHDSTNASEDARFAGLLLQGKRSLAASGDVAIREAKLVKLIAEIEGDGRITSQTAMNAAGLELAKGLAPLVKAFKEKMEAHNEARLEAIKYAAQTSGHDAVSGWGSTESRVIYGERNMNRHAQRTTDEFIELDGKPIQRLASWNAVDDVLETVKALVEHTPESLEEHPTLAGFVTVHKDGSRPHEWIAPIAA